MKEDDEVGEQGLAEMELGKRLEWEKGGCRLILLRSLLPSHSLAPSQHQAVLTKFQGLTLTSKDCLLLARI